MATIATTTTKAVTKLETFKAVLAVLKDAGVSPVVARKVKKLMSKSLTAKQMAAKVL